MSCNSNHQPCCNNGRGFLIIVVLYILLAVIVGPYIS